jgi:hypothetical protein
VGAAFWPDTPKGYAAFRLFRLPVVEPLPVECSYTIGGGEYLNFAQAEAWQPKLAALGKLGRI